MLLKVSQRQKLERQKLESQTQVGEEKIKSQWDSPQKRTDFNRKMREKLKKGIRDLSDMVLLLESLPPTVLENAKLMEDLPRVIMFAEVFLEKVDPLPVAEYESGEKRTFRNYATCMENHPGVDAFKAYIKNINGRKYLINSDTVTASPIEIRHCDILKEHIENLQRYVDPSIVLSGENSRKKHPRELSKETVNKMNMMGHCGSHLQLIVEKIPINPPCSPRVLIDGMLYDVPITEEDCPAPSDGQRLDGP